MLSIQVIFGLFIFLLVMGPQSESVVFKLTNAVCESYNKSRVVIHTCRLKAIKRNKVIFNFNGTILYPVNDIRIHLQVFKRANGYKPWLFNIEVDACRFYRQAYNPVAILFLNLTREFSNFNHTCPYVGPIFIKGFYPRAEVLRLPYPTGDYLLASRWYYDKKLQIDANVSYTFVKNILDQ